MCIGDNIIHRHRTLHEWAFALRGGREEERLQDEQSADFVCHDMARKLENALHGVHGVSVRKTSAET